MRIVDLFCGGGGLSKGMADAGHEIVAAYDWWQPALNFYNHNIRGHHAEQLDLSNVEKSVDEIRKWRPDAIIGGPPCQDFSSAGKRDENGGRASLTIAYARIVTAVHPRMFVMENVERAIKTRTYRSALRYFKHAGYNLAVAVLDASLCGAPQARKRIVVVGALGLDVSPILAYYREHQAHVPMTVRDYFGNDIDIDFYYRHPRSYARRGVFSIDEPSPTIRGVNRPVPHGYKGHVGDAAPINTPGIRPLTTRERSRIQTFPREWELFGNKSDLEQIIGNAVPCALGEFVGRSLEEFERIPHRRLTQDEDSVQVFFQYAHPRTDDVRTVPLEEYPNDIFLTRKANKQYEQLAPHCEQLLLAVERGKAKLGKKAVKRAMKGKKLVQKKTGAKSVAKKASGAKRRTK